MPAKRRLASVEPAKAGEVEESVRATLEKLQLQPEDAALATLAVRYARTIDQAAAIAAQAARLPFDPDTADAVEQLRKRVSAQVTMADLGPKLLAALDALQATPKARIAAGKPTPAGVKSKLTALRETSA